MTLTRTGILRTFLIDPEGIQAPTAHAIWVFRDVLDVIHRLQWENGTHRFKVILIRPIQGPEINERIVDCREADVTSLIEWLKPFQGNGGTR